MSGGTDTKNHSVEFEEQGVTFIIAGGVKAWGFPPEGISPATVTFSSVDPTSESYAAQHSLIVDNGNVYGFTSDDDHNILGTVYLSVEVSDDEDNETVMFAVTTDDGFIARCVYDIDQSHKKKDEAAKTMLRVFEQLTIAVTNNQSFLRSQQTSLFPAEVRAINKYLLAGEGEPSSWVDIFTDDPQWNGWRVLSPYHPESILVDAHRFLNDLSYIDAERAFIPLSSPRMPRFGYYSRFNIAPPPNEESLNSMTNILVAINNSMAKIGEKFELSEGDELLQYELDGCELVRITGKDETNFFGSDDKPVMSYYQYFVDDDSDCAILLSYQTRTCENSFREQLTEIGHTMLRSIRETRKNE